MYILKRHYDFLVSIAEEYKIEKKLFFDHYGDDEGVRKIHSNIEVMLKELKEREK